MGKEKKGGVMRTITIILAYVLVLALWIGIGENPMASLAAMASCGIVFYIIACLAKENAFLHYLALHIAFWAGGFAVARGISMVLNTIM